jgi:hypothetical protein
MQPHWIFITIGIFFSATLAYAFEKPDWRPDGTVVVCSKIPFDPTRGACDKQQAIAWPHENALLIGAGPKEVPAFVHDWEEFHYYYFAPYLSLRCGALRSKELSNGLTINEYLRAANDPHKLFAELGVNKDCVQAGRGWIRTDRLRPWTPPQEIFKEEGLRLSKLNNDHYDSPRNREVERLRKISLDILGEDALAPKLISKHIGDCIVEPARWRKTKPRNVSGYDKFFLPYWRKKSEAQVTLPSGRKLYSDDLQAIDAVSRTIYGEVQSCQFNWKDDEYNPGHFEAVGRLIADRAEAIGTGTDNGSRDFGRPSSVPLMEQVVSRNGQFNNWDLVIRGRPRKLNGALLNSLCPKNEKNKNAFVGPKESLSEEHDEIWSWAVEVASQAYLNRGAYQLHYPWKINGSLFPALKIMFYSHGRAKPSSRYAQFKRLAVDGVGPYKLEAAPFCDPFKTWKAVPKTR